MQGEVERELHRPSHLHSQALLPGRRERRSERAMCAFSAQSRDGTARERSTRCVYHVAALSASSVYTGRNPLGRVVAIPYFWHATPHWRPGTIGALQKRSLLCGSRFALHCPASLYGGRDSLAAGFTRLAFRLRADLLLLVRCPTVPPLRRFAPVPRHSTFVLLALSQRSPSRALGPGPALAVPTEPGWTCRASCPTITRVYSGVVLISTSTPPVRSGDTMSGSPALAAWPCMLLRMICASPLSVPTYL